MTAIDVDALDLRSAVVVPHDVAYAALDEADTSAAAAVAWCSAHLVAVGCVLYPAVQRRLPQGQRRVRALRAVDHRLQQALFRLDRRLTGDAHLCATPVEAFADEVRVRLRAHADAECQALDELTAVLEPQEQESLAGRLEAAMRTAPTRPHPHTPHTPFAHVIAQLEAGVDGVRDLMDNRVVATPRRSRPARVPGRWGCYLMGTPYPVPQERSD